LWTYSEGNLTSLQDKSKFVAFQQTKEKVLTNILFFNNQLHVDIIFDKNSKVGKSNLAGIHDILLEAAVTAIV
jgi:malate synthase